MHHQVSVRARAEASLSAPRQTVTRMRTNGDTNVYAVPMATTTTFADALAQLDAEISATEHALDDLRLQRKGAEAFMQRLGLDVTVTSDSASGVVTPAKARAVRPVRANSVTGYTGAVADLLVQHPEGIALVEIKENLARQGTSLDPDQVRSAVTYLRRKHQAEPVSRGIWRSVIRPANADSPALTGLSVLVPATQEGGGASGTDTHRVRDDPSSWQAEHLDHDLGAPVGTGA